MLKCVGLLNIKRKEKQIIKITQLFFFPFFIPPPLMSFDMPFWLCLEICVFAEIFLCHFMYVFLFSFMRKFCRLCISFCSY